MEKDFTISLPKIINIMDESTSTEPKETVTVESMVKNQQEAHHERMMVLLHVLERLAKIETRLDSK